LGASGGRERDCFGGGWLRWPRIILGFVAARGAMGVTVYVQTNPGLEELVIYGGWFGDDDAEELGAALAHNTSLKKLSLYCSFGARVRGITEALKTSTVIDVLVFFGKFSNRRCWRGAPGGPAGVDLVLDGYNH
jgi:hypothetical protein